MFKRLVFIVALFLAAAVATLFLTPFLVSPQSVARVVESQLKQATGRAVSLGGSVDLSVFPDLVARIGQVTIANAQGMGETPLAEMEAIDAKVRLLPLLQGRVEIDRLTLVEPRIVLAMDAAGRRNWSFDTPAAETPDAPAQAREEPASSGGLGAPVEITGIADLTVERGALVFHGASGTVEEFSDIDARVRWPRFDQALDLAATLTWRNVPLSLSGQIAAPQRLADGDTSDVAVALAVGDLKSTLVGRLNFGVDIAGDGRVELSSPSLRDTAALFGVTVPGREGFGPVALNGDLAVGGNRVSLANAALQLDGNTADGAIGMTLAARPALRATLAFANLDLNPYRASEPALPSAQGNAAPAPESAGTPAARPSWSNTPIDLSGLTAINADIRLSASQIQLGDLPLGAGALTVSTSEGQMVAEIGDLQGYGGNLIGTLNVRAETQPASYALALAARDVALRPFLSDLLGLDRVSAAGHVDLSLKSHGASEQEIMSNLAGTATAVTGPGTITGIDLTSLAGLLGSGNLEGWQAAGGGETPFERLQASFAIENGVARNDDLQLLGPTVTAEGAGMIDLAGRMLDYRLETSLASGLPAQADGTAQNLVVPIILRGSWEQPSIFVDPAGLLQNAPVVEQTVKGVRDAIKSGDLKAVEDQLENSGLKSLFDNLTGRKKN